ncbi:MAG: hypothetical protein K8J08_19785 [Thermoanaerobaculia bacterium]|nr:hypothetical protein [Thermoanaerobaculia bacterium]
MAFKREKVVRNAEKYVSKGKIESAIKEYMKVLQEYPNEAGTLNRVGDLYARIDKDDDAIRLFTQIAEQYSEQGFFVKGIAIYKKILRLDPTRLQVYERLGGLYSRQGLINEARGQFQILADHYLKNTDAAAAINIYVRMAEMEPDNPSHHLKLAELYQQMQLWDKAMRSYDAIAGLMLDHDRVEEAFRVYQRAIEVHPSDLEFIRNSIGKLQAAGGPGPAARLLAAAIEINPAAQSIASQMRPQTDEIELIPGIGEIDPDAPEASPVDEFQADQWSASDFEGEEVEAVELVAYDVDEDDIGGTSGIVELEIDLDSEMEISFGDDAEGMSTLVEPPSDVPGPGSAFAGAAEAETLGIEGVAFDMDTDGDLDSDDEAAPKPSGPSRGLGEEEFGAERGLSDEVEFDLELDLELEEDFDPGDGSLEEKDQVAEEVGVEGATTGQVVEAEPEPSGPTVQPEELVAEAEVFAKYGLSAKARERVALVLASYPDLVSARRLELLLSLESGDSSNLAEMAQSFRELTTAQGDETSWDTVAPRLAEAGIRVTEAEVEIVTPPTLPPEPKKERVSKLLEALEEPVVPRRRGGSLNIDAALAELTSGLTGPSRKRKSTPTETPTPDEPVEEIATPMAPPSVDIPAGLPPENVPIAAAPTVETEADAQPSVEPASELPTLELEPPVLDEVPSGTPPEAPWDDEPVPTLDDEDLDLELDGFKLPEERPAEPLSLDDSAMNWLDEIPAQPTVEAVDESLFDDEEDFFDLAAELEQELVRDDAANLADDIVSPPEEPSLEDIVEGFKRGVAENLSEQDYGTHYNLGIAYREMGLIDEAIGEFQLASKDPAHLVECCSMLGICFTEKGLFDLAVKWYKRGLEAPDLREETMLNLLYDMGDAYLSNGDEDSARKTFTELMDLNVGFRDVLDRLETLGGS